MRRAAATFLSHRTVIRGGETQKGIDMPRSCIRAAFAAALFAASLFSSTAFALEAGDWLVRFRGIGVFPTDDSSGVTPTFPGDGVEALPMGVPEFDITYMVTENFGLELIAAVSPHDVDGTGPTLAGVGKVADLWLLPPTLTAQWHFMPKSSVRPYVGAGINVTIPFGEDASTALATALGGGAASIDVDPTVGFAAQIGVDIDITDRWFANLDLKYIMIEPDATIRSTTFATQRTTVKINPIIFGAGIGYRF